VGTTRCLSRATILLVITSVCLVASVDAADYPNRPITLIVPFSPGGSADILARIVAKGLTERLGKAVVVDNRPGAGGLIGTGIAARAIPDGHTLLFAGSTTLVVEPALRSNVGYDSQHDFASITVIAETPLVLVASPSLKVKNLSELLALARQKPGQLTYASFGIGSSAHLAGEMLKVLGQVDLLHVPYKGGAPALTDVVGGQVSTGFVTALAAMANIRAGRVDALAVASSKRLPALPNVPTIAESGVSGFGLETWTAVLAQTKTAREVIARWSKETVAVLRSPEVSRSIEDQGAIVVASGPGEVTRRMQSDIAAISRLLKSVNIKAED
jgi:tripartite-type tricarboxylate transporter receptor subunit TctC